MSESQTLTPPHPSSRQTPDRPGTGKLTHRDGAASNIAPFGDYGVFERNLYYLEPLGTPYDQ